MQVRLLLSAALLSSAAFAALADPAGDSFTNAAGATRYSASSLRSREAVVAELRNAQAAGELRRVGELADAQAATTVPTGQAALTRSQVRAELAQARSRHEVRLGELM